MGLQILVAPCNQFGGQEPGSASEIEAFVNGKCPGGGLKVLEKVDVNGPNTAPLFSWLKGAKSRPLANDIAWNFEKFLIDRDGKPVERYLPPTSPLSFEDKITALLEM